MRASGLIATLLWSWSVSALGSPSNAPLEAPQMLEQSSVVSTVVDSAQNRVRALAETIQTCEAGLTAMRDGLCDVALRDAQLMARLQVREQGVAQLSGVLQTIETTVPPAPISHPSGSLGVAPTGMMLSEVIPGLNALAQALVTDLHVVQTLRQLKQNAVDTLTEGLTGVQNARTQLSEDNVDRIDLPRRLFEVPTRTITLTSSTETLEGFASGVSEHSESEIIKSNAEVTSIEDRISSPTQGVMLPQLGEVDTAGMFGPGLVSVKRLPAAVVSPTAATIRYHRSLLDLGNLVILESQPGLLFVFSGLQENYGQIRDIIAENIPANLMPDNPARIRSDFFNKR